MALTEAMASNHQRVGALAILAAAAMAAVVVAPPAIWSNQPALHRTVVAQPQRPVQTHARVVSAPANTQAPTATGRPVAPDSSAQAPATTGPTVSSVPPRADPGPAPPQIVSGDEGPSQTLCLKPKGCR